MYHYFYKITNNLNGHFYYGIHSTDNLLDDGYMGSGTRLHIAYKKYGVENFTKEILKFFDTRKECAEYEAEVVNESLVLDNNCYNIQQGGETYNTKNEIVVSLKSEPTKFFMIHINEFYKNRELYNTTTENKQCYLSKNKVVVKDKNGNVFKIDKSSPKYLNGEYISILIGTKWSSKQREKTEKTFKEINHQCGQKNSRYNTIWINKDGKSTSIKKDDLDLYINNGWNIGRIQIKNDCIWINDGNISKPVKKDQLKYYLSNGWLKGRVMNSIWIHKKDEIKRIKIKDLEYYLSNGWLKGRKIN